jgi:hypothetical protein
MMTIEKILARARRMGRIADGLVLCDNCDTPATRNEQFQRAGAEWKATRIVMAIRSNNHRLADALVFSDEDWLRCANSAGYRSWIGPTPECRHMVLAQLRLGTSLGIP